MTEQKKTQPAKADKNAKTELTEQQLQDISGGPIYMSNRLQVTQVVDTGPNLQPIAPLNTVKP